MAPKPKRAKRATLFDPDCLQSVKSFRATNFPYSLAMESLQTLVALSVPEAEACAFADVVRHETCAYEARGFIYGPLSFVDTSPRGKRLRCMTEPLRIPSFVEPDVLTIARCDARFLLLVDDWKVFDALSRSSLVDDTGILLMTGCGIPRIGARRLMNRLEREFNVRVLLLTDNDTWGYWIYSVLKRGLMAPGAESRYAAIKHVSFVGLRAGEWKRFGVPAERLRPWEPQWDVRLTQLRKQRCFRSRVWQREFDRFAADALGLDLRALVEHLGVDEFNDAFLKPRLK